MSSDRESRKWEMEDAILGTEYNVTTRNHDLL